MTRNPKVLGAAAIAILTMAAMASAAQAAPAHFQANSPTGSVILHETTDAASPLNTLVTNFGAIECDEVTATGTSASSASTVTATDVTYRSNFFGAPGGPCEGFGLELSLEFNSCAYVFHAGTWDGGGMSTGTMDIECEPGEEIELVTAFCTVSFPPQTGLGPVTYSTIGNDVTLEANINPGMGEGEGIKYSGEGLFCSDQADNGSYEGAATVTAVEDEGGVPGASVAVKIAED
jgi:hypothetical protein